MMWALLMIVLLVALMIPLTAVILDSQVGRALAARLERDRDGAGAPDHRLTALESEVERLTRDLQRLDEESAFLHRLLEGKPASQPIPPGDRPA